MTKDWMVGVTTCHSRRVLSNDTTLREEQLERAGFNRYWIFSDGGTPEMILRPPGAIGVTVRDQFGNAYGNWLLGMLEMYLRNPNADYYAMFQDDILSTRNLKDYLEQLKFPDNGYLNLYTFPTNYKNSSKKVGLHITNQSGLGALGLVFTNDVLVRILPNNHLIDRVKDVKRGHKSIDGAVVSAANKVGIKEYIHVPSLLQHTGAVTSISGNRVHPQANTFPGQDFDARELIQCAGQNWETWWSQYSQRLASHPKR